MNVSVDDRGLKRFKIKIESFIKEIPGAMERHQHDEMQKLLKAVVRHASGRPGPNIVTGHYITSIYIRGNEVRSDAIQSARLEYGFVGLDQTGRYYNQPPFPHFRPALEEVRRDRVETMLGMILKTWRQA